MANELFPFQIEGAQWLAARKTALLADSPRMGKAVQSITACDIIGAARVLVVCRGAARFNWRTEFETWSKRRWRFSLVFGRADRIDFGLLGPHCVVCNYENLESTLRQIPAKYRFDVAIIDESHYVKSVDAKRTGLVFGREGVPAKASRIWCTTGTPTPNGLASELWTTLYTFGATKLDFWAFAKRYCRVVENGYGPQIVGTRVNEPETMAELRAVMAKKILRREAKDVAVQLPKMSFSTVMVPPGKVDLRATTMWKWQIPNDRTDELNRLLEQEMGILNGILDDKTLSHGLVEALKANAKSISTLRRYTALQKLDAACELIAAELDAGAYRKVVIFAHHRDCIMGAAQRLHKFSPVTMYGGSNPLRVERNIKNFQNPKHKVRVVIGNISAAGTSISLSAANHIFFLEESFVPEDNTQAAMRCGGVNQPNPVFVRTFCLEHSYDRHLQDIIRQKMIENAAIYKQPVPKELLDLI